MKMLTALILSLSLSAHAANNCANSLLGSYKKFAKLEASEAFGVRADFVLDTTYDKEVPGTEIKNQCGWGGCWGYSISTVFEALIKSFYDVDISLDPQYLIAMQIVARGQQAMAEYGRSYSEGERVDFVFNLIEEFGAVPSASWKPKIDITQHDVADRFYFFVNHVVEKYQLALKDLPEASTQKREQLLKKGKAELLALVESVMGPLPRKFVFDETEFTPVQFAKEVLKINSLGLVNLVPKIEHRENPNASSKAKKETLTDRPWIVTGPSDFDRIEASIIREIDAGRPVWLSIDWQRAFLDPKMGLASIAAFHNPFPDFAIDRSYRDVFGSRSGHIVVIVGYKRGPDGQLSQLKIHNSWGEKAGDHGYYHIQRDYFEAFTSAIGVFVSRSNAEKLKSGRIETPVKKP